MELAGLVAGRDRWPTRQEEFFDNGLLDLYRRAERVVTGQAGGCLCATQPAARMAAAGPWSDPELNGRLTDLWTS